MKINKIQVVDDILKITLDSIATDFYNIFVDSLTNRASIYASEPEKHMYHTAMGVDTDIIEIPMSELALAMIDSSAMIITVGDQHAFYYDAKELYYAEVDLLTSYCSTCLDKELKDRMVLFMVKQSLLQHAIANGMFEALMDHYTDIARMLNITIQSNTSIPCHTIHSTSTGGSTCYNGTCSTC